MRNTSPHPQQQPNALTLDLLKLKATGKNNHPIQASLSYVGLTTLTEQTEVAMDADITLVFSSTGFIFHGRLKGQLQQACDTCGVAFEREIDIKVDEDYVFAHLGPKFGGSDRELGEDDFYEIHAIDIPFDVTAMCQELLILELSGDAYCQEHWQQRHSSPDDEEDED